LGGLLNGRQPAATNAAPTTNAPANTPSAVNDLLDLFKKPGKQ